MVSPSEVEGFIQNVQNCTINYSIPPISQEHLKLWLQNAPNLSSNISMEEDDHFSYFQSEKSNPSENSSLEYIFLHGFDNALSSSNNMQTTKSHGAGGKEGFESGEEHSLNEREGGGGVEPKQCKQSKGKRSAQGRRRLHRMVSRRSCRQKINKKLRALQEIIPNCSERGQASILDDAINYIKKMQFQLELMTSMMTTWSTFRPSPGTITIPTGGEAGMQIPSLSPFLQMGTRNIGEIKYEIGTRTLDSSSSASSYSYPMGLSNSYFLPPPATACQMQQSTVSVLPTRIVPSHHHVDTGI